MTELEGGRGSLQQQGFSNVGMRRVAKEEEEEDEESEMETEIGTEGLWWKKCEPFGEAWSFSGSAVGMLNESSERPVTKVLWWWQGK